MTSTPQKTSNISIIIPTLNEEANIAALAFNLKCGGHERIIIDGGSSDNTVRIARDLGFTVYEGASGRAAQLNLGAAKAKGTILLFLHADTQLPDNFSQTVSEAVSTKNFIAGAFHLAIKDGTPSQRFIAACANVRSCLFNLPYGDQAIFVQKKRFFELNKFPDLPIMEDYVFIKNARKKGKIVILPDKVITSSRRWQRLGVFRTTLINQLIILGYYLKISPKRLSLFYRR